MLRIAVPSVLQQSTVSIGMMIVQAVVNPFGTQALAGYTCLLYTSPTKDKKLLFVEKLSFSLPYQVLEFDNRKQLKNYLMGMYDISWGQEEAKPFIMESTKTAL